MKANKTIKNWRWWVVLIPSLLAIAIMRVLMVIATAAELIANAINSIDCEPNKEVVRKISKWVHKNNSEKQK